MTNILKDCPIIERTERTGYFKPIQPWKPETLYINACDVCNQYEAEVKFHNTKLCSGCCKEEGITIL